MAHLCACDTDSWHWIRISHTPHSHRFDTFDEEYSKKRKKELPLWVPELPVAASDRRRRQALDMEELQVLPSTEQHPLRRYTTYAGFDAESAFSFKPIHRPTHSRCVRGMLPRPFMVSLDSPISWMQPTPSPRSLTHSHHLLLNSCSTPAQLLLHTGSSRCMAAARRSGRECWWPMRHAQGGCTWSICTSLGSDYRR